MADVPPCYRPRLDSSEHYCSLSNVEQLLVTYVVKNGSYNAAVVDAVMNGAKKHGCSLSGNLHGTHHVVGVPLSSCRGAVADCQSNLLACENEWDSCNTAALTSADKYQVAAARHEQNIANCKNTLPSCDRSTLSGPEQAEVATATHQNMVVDCWSGLTACDHGKLTPAEAAEVAVADKQKNVSDCWNGWSSCDPAELSPSELSDVAVAQRRRNVSQCWIVIRGVIVPNCRSRNWRR